MESSADWCAFPLFPLRPPPHSPTTQIGKITTRFEEKGFKLVGLKLVQPTRTLLEAHYADLAGKSFFDGLVGYMMSGPVVAMVWEGTGMVAAGRKMMGATRPSESAPGTIRGDFCIDVGRNVIHGSDSVENAQREMSLWFPEGVVSWASHSAAWVYERV
jgi:nucleoside-diphosphate kinase